MSDNEVEIVFENVAGAVFENGRETHQKNRKRKTKTETEENSSEMDVICLSPVPSDSKIPKISAKATEKTRRQIEVDHPTLKFKSVKNASKNQMDKKSLHLSSVKDNINGYSVPPRILTQGKADATVSEATTFKASPVNPRHDLENSDILIDSYIQTISEQSGKSIDLHLTSEFSVSPKHLQKKESEFKLSPLKSLAEDGQVNNSKDKLHSGKPQCTQKNEIIVDSTSSSSNPSGETKDTQISSPELLQSVQKNMSIKDSASSSTPESSELGKVHNFKQHDSGTPQCSPNNKISFNSSSFSTDRSGGSKGSKTSFSELLQRAQKNKELEITPFPSTSALSERAQKKTDIEITPFPSRSESSERAQKNKDIEITPFPSTTESSERAQKNKDIEITPFPSTSKSSERAQKNKDIEITPFPSTSESSERAQKKKDIEITPFPSTSELSEPVHSGTSPSSTQPQIKLSYQLSKRPNKFSINGSPASSPKNRMLYSSVKKNPTSGHKAYLSFTNNKSPGNHLSDASVKRKLNFSNSCSEVSSSVVNGEISERKNPLGDETEPVTSSFQTYSQTFDAYLLRQLKLHIDVVLEDSCSRSLINDHEMDIIQLFMEMNSECQDLYARMHNRKYKWNRLSDITYETATQDNLHVLEEKSFLVTDMKDVSLADMIDLLKIQELKELCKSFGIKSAQNKKKLSKEMIDYCQSQRTLGFQPKVVSSEEVVKERIESILGPCFILSHEPRGLFRRIHLLFNLKFNRNEQSRGGSQDLFEIQFVGTEKALYPKSSIDKTVNIFASREDLLKFQIADDLHVDFTTAVSNKDFNKAETLLNTIRDNFVSQFEFISEFDDTPRTSAISIPLSLRKFTPGTVYAYVLNEGVDVLKKLKKKEKAIDILLLLLDQSTFLPYMRGRWYEKLVTLRRTAGHHLQVAKTICAAMRDPHVDDQCLYVMTCRIRELLKKKLKGADREIKTMLFNVPQFPELEYMERFEIRACALEGKSGYKRVYIQDDETGGGKKFSSVEELVKSHFCPRKFTRGMHAENSLPTSLFGILFWDIIYEHHVPCAFISPYQTRPLDLSSGEFYKNRQAAIDTKLAKMTEWTDDDVSSWVTDIWSKNYGKSSLVHWRCFSNAADILNIIKCIGLQVLSKICERYAKKYRGVRSGFPDLFLWSPGERKKYKFVEVKGPNDTLSTNQKLWLDFLVKIEANVEICSVVAQGSKALSALGQPSPTFEGAEVDEM